MGKKRRIAICGFNLESNRFAPTCARGDFRENMYFVGNEISTEARKDSPAIHLGVKGFYNEMDKIFGDADGWVASVSNCECTGNPSVDRGREQEPAFHVRCPWECACPAL